MGWRISLYCVPKYIAELHRNVTQDEYNKSQSEIWRDLENERIAYDTLTNIICGDTDNKFSTKYFTNKLEIEEDIYFGTISREQLLNIIEEMRKSTAKWYYDRRVVFKKDGVTELGDMWTDPEGYYLGIVDDKMALEKNQHEWNHKMIQWNSVWNGDRKNHYHNINVDLDNKWIISGSLSMEYAIFDVIHILKIFDWENDVLICIGG